MKPIIVIGSGMAGISLIREVRKPDTETPIILVTADDGGFTQSLCSRMRSHKTSCRPSLRPRVPRKSPSKLAVTVLHHTRLEQIDTDAKRIKTSMGDFEYRDLVLATGAKPIRLSIPGSASEDILSVNHFE